MGESLAGAAAAERLAVIGQGYVGLPLAVRADEVGYDVVGVNLDPTRIEHLVDCQSYVEDLSDQSLAAAITTGRFTATVDPDDAKKFDIPVISLPSPLSDWTPELGHVEAAATSLAQFLSPGVTVILESTTYVGTTEDLVRPSLTEGSGVSPKPSGRRARQRCQRVHDRVRVISSRLACADFQRPSAPHEL